MRRIRIAWAIVALSVLLCVISHLTVLRITQAVQQQLLQARELAAAKKYESAAQQLEGLLEYYDSRQHFLELFLRRETVAAASVNLHGLPAYAKEETVRDLYSEIDKATEQIRAMEHLFSSVF